MSRIIRVYKDFLENYSLSKDDINKIEYCDNNGYRQIDAIFDRIMFRDFCLMLRKTNKFDLWLKLGDGMDKNITSADETFDEMCELTMIKVQELLR